MTSGPDPGELPGFWGSMVFRHAPIPRKGSGNQQQQQKEEDERKHGEDRVGSIPKESGFAKEERWQAKMTFLGEA